MSRTGHRSLDGVNAYKHPSAEHIRGTQQRMSTAYQGASAASEPATPLHVAQHTSTAALAGSVLARPAHSASAAPLLPSQASTVIDLDPGVLDGDDDKFFATLPESVTEGVPVARPKQQARGNPQQQALMSDQQLHNIMLESNPSISMLFMASKETNGH